MGTKRDQTPGVLLSAYLGSSDLTVTTHVWLQQGVMGGWCRRVRPTQPWKGKLLAGTASSQSPSEGRVAWP